MNDGITNYTFSGNDVCIIYLFSSVFSFGLVLVLFGWLVGLFCQRTLATGMDVTNFLWY